MVLSLSTVSAFACGGKKSPIRGQSDIIFENESIQLVVLSHLMESNGCLEWGVHTSRSKNKICKSVTENKKAKYVKGSMTKRDDLGSYSNIPVVGSLIYSDNSIDEIVCIIKK